MHIRFLSFNLGGLGSCPECAALGVCLSGREEECWEGNFRQPLPYSVFFWQWSDFSDLRLSLVSSNLVFMWYFCSFHIKLAHLLVPLSSFHPHPFLSILLCPFIETLIWVKILQTALLSSIFFSPPRPRTRWDFCDGCRFPSLFESRVFLWNLSEAEME